MFLVDANVFVEVLIKGFHFEKASEFLQKIGSDSIAITDFTLHSIGILLSRNNLDEVYMEFLRDLEESSVRILKLDIKDLESVITVRRRYSIDFDDAYQYVAAEKYDLIIVSYDSDFNRTPRGRKTPEEILNEL